MPVLLGGRYRTIRDTPRETTAALPTGYILRLKETKIHDETTKMPLPNSSKFFKFATSDVTEEERTSHLEA